MIRTVGDDNDYTLTVWAWRERKALASQATGKAPNKVFRVVWLSDSELVTVGVRHCTFWTFAGGKLRCVVLLLCDQRGVHRSLVSC